MPLDTKSSKRTYNVEQDGRLVPLDPKRVLRSRLRLLLAGSEVAARVAKNLHAKRGDQLSPWMSSFDIDLDDEILPILNEGNLFS